MSAKILKFPPAPIGPPLSERLNARREYRDIASAAVTEAFSRAFNDPVQAAVKGTLTRALELDEAVILFLAAMRREVRGRVRARQ